MRWIFLSIYLILPAALWPWVDSASNRNEYQESWLEGVKGSRHVRLTTSPPSVSQLSRENAGASTSHNLNGPSRPVTERFTFTFLSYMCYRLPLWSVLIHNNWMVTYRKSEFFNSVTLFLNLDTVFYIEFLSQKDHYWKLHSKWHVHSCPAYKIKWLKRWLCRLHSILTVIFVTTLFYTCYWRKWKFVMLYK
jgi:hypothetical protein